MGNDDICDIELFGSRVFGGGGLFSFGHVQIKKKVKTMIPPPRVLFPPVYKAQRTTDNALFSTLDDISIRSSEQAKVYLSDIASGNSTPGTPWAGIPTYNLKVFGKTMGNENKRR